MSKKVLSSDEEEAKMKEVTPLEVEAEEIPENKENRKMKGIIHSLEVMAMQRSSRNNLDISKFTDAQRDKLLDIMQQNEKNAFAYHTKRLEVSENINEKLIASSTVNQRTGRMIGVLFLCAMFIMMIVILIFKDEYFTEFLSFVAGLGGGMGLRGFFSSFIQKPKLAKVDDEDDE